MHRTIQKIIQFKTEFKLEQVYNAFVVLIIALILILAASALHRPINVERFNTVKQIANQSIYPDTQNMAQALLAQPEISFGQYLKLMQAHQMEMTQAKQLPPVSSDEY